MSDGPALADEDAIREAIANVRADSHDSDWAACTYTDNKTLALHGSGSGGVTELVSGISDNQVIYALVRKTEMIDVSTTVKFAFVKYVGDNCPRMLRARLGTHSGTIAKLYEPYHVTLDTEDLDEITDDAVASLIGFASGTKVHVLDEETAAARGATGSYGHSAKQAGGEHSAPVEKTSMSLTGNDAPAAPAPVAEEKSEEADAESKPKPTKTASPKKAPGAAPASSGGTIKFVDEEATRDAIADVRSDASDTTWCLVGYQGKKGNTLELLGKGAGGYADFAAQLEDDMVGYALVRKTEMIDQNETVKFAFLSWVGANINRMHRARLGTYSGEVRELFTPFHVNLDGEAADEFSDEIIEKAIAVASGAHSHILPDNE
jgi:drebrin-like protein